MMEATKESRRLKAHKQLLTLRFNLPSQAKPSQAKPSQAKPSQAKPSQAKPSQAKPSQAGDQPNS
jgi:hypothetical protein